MCLAGFVLSAVPSPSPWYSCWQDLWFQHFFRSCGTSLQNSLQLSLSSWSLGCARLSCPSLSVHQNWTLGSSLDAVNTYSMMSLEVLVAAREGNTSVSSLSIFFLSPLSQLIVFIVYILWQWIKKFLRMICGVHLCDCIPLMKDLTAIACSAILSPSRLLCTHASSRPEHSLCFPLTYRRFRNVRRPPFDNQKVLVFFFRPQTSR